jgi:hypothetical protein
MSHQLQGKEKFLEIVKKYNVCSDSLLEFLDASGFYKAPASTVTTLHNAFEGGLVDHLITLTRRTIVVNETNAKLDARHKCDPNSIARVSILHGIGRSLLYKPNPSEWHKKNLGKMYEFNDKLVSMTPGERALFYVQKYGGNMILTEHEFQAILGAEKDIANDDAAKWHSEPLTLLLRQQIEWAISTEKLDYLETNGK